MDSTNIFRDKVFIVTGGSRGLGLATAKTLLAHKALVISVSRTFTEPINELHETLQLDVTDQQACHELAKHVDTVYGRLDGLVNNAGIISHSSITDVKQQDITKILNNNVTGLIMITQALWPLLIRTKGNAIVNVSSAGARTGNPNELAYAASKGAVDAITRTLARDGGQYELSVNSIAPHVIDSGMGQETLKADPTTITRIPFKRGGKVEEFTNLVLFLLSGNSPYLTGQVIHLNGGRLMLG